MKRIIRTARVPVLTAALALLITGCPAATPVNDEVPSAEETPSAAKLFTLVTETDPFETWAQFPGLEGTVESAAPHGPMSRTWINEEVESALTNYTGSLPVGSVIVKENLGESDTDKANSWTIMWKVTGFDPDHNDWFWANITPEGVVNAEGKVDGCIACHSGAQDNDFVFQHDFGDGQ